MSAGASLAALVDASAEVARTRGRNDKRDRLARYVASLEDDVREVGLAFLVGELVQGKIGVGWATVRDLDAGSPAADATLTLTEVSGVLDAVASVRGAGATRERARLLGALFARATDVERRFLGRLLVGEVRQGALDGVVLEALAVATRLSPAAVRRAVMLGGSLPKVGAELLRSGASALDRYALVPFRPVLPMLASPVTDVEEALSELGEAAFELKLDGARVQVHKDEGEVRVYTRALHDVTARVPEIVAVARALPVRTAVLDGEALAFTADGAPLPFQTTMRRFGRKVDVDALARELPLSVRFFDVLHAEGALLDAPLRERRGRLEALVPESARVPAIVTADIDEAERFYAVAVARGHEGLMAKSLDAAYEAGARGAAWRKIKPAHTLDLVVLAVERGSGRRTGWLSNVHLGARDPVAGGFVMLGKTFKGLTDELLAWQTEKLQALAVREQGITLEVRPELVVEIAFDGVQTSSRYPGGMALRFARVVRYRDDKTAAEADTIDAVRAIHAGRVTG